MCRPEEYRSVLRDGRDCVMVRDFAKQNYLEPSQSRPPQGDTAGRLEGRTQ